MLSLPLYDDHTQAHTHPTALQLALFQLWCAALFLLLSRYFSGKTSSSSSSSSSSSPSTPKSEPKGDVKINVEQSEALLQKGANGTGEATAQEKKPKLFTPVKPPPTFDEFLRCLVVLGVIMFYFYLGDYAKVRKR
jgi:hypothetical protein